jgi:hypothetical protein
MASKLKKSDPSRSTFKRKALARIKTSRELRKMGEMTGVAAIGTAPETALGAVPCTRRRKKKRQVKVEFIGAVGRAASPLIKRAAPLARKAGPALRKIGSTVAGIARDPQKRRQAFTTAKLAAGHAKNVHRAFKFAKRAKTRFSGSGQQRGGSAV